MTDIDEQQPDAVLKGAEYVEYLGLYFNREKEAAAAIQHIVDNYMCTQKAVEGVVQENEPVPVLWAQYWSGATCSDGSSVSNETDMERMFRGASSFNQPLHAPWYVVQPWVEQSDSE